MNEDINNKTTYTLTSAAGVALSVPAEIGAWSAGPFALCRMCLFRMNLSMLEKIMLCFVIEAEESGTRCCHSYADMGKILGRCEHSVKQAAATLRKAGLVVTSRGKAGTVVFSCGPFVVWAANAIRAVGGTAVPAPVVQEEPRRRRRRRETEAGPAAKKEATPVVMLPEPAAELPAEPPHEDYEEASVDNSEEVAGTLRAAGRAAGAQSSDDSDDFSFGSDTAETDMGYGVRINPDI